MKTPASAIVLFLLTIVLTLALLSCASQNEEVPSFMDSYEFTYDKYDLDGIDVVIGSGQGDIFGSLDNNTLISDETKKHIETVENELNCTFSYVFDGDVYAMSNKVFTSVLGGTEYIDMIYFTQRYLDGYHQFYIPLDIYEELDLTSSKWQFGESLEICKYYGQIYAVCPTYWQGLLPSYYSALLYNRDLVTSFEENDPQEYFETKTWTWDVFEQYLTKCHRVEPSKTIYAMNGRSDFLSCMAVYSNGGQICEETADGKLRFTLNDDNALEAINWAAELFIREKGVSLKPETGDDYGHDIAPFSQNELTFLLYPSWSGTSQSAGWPAMELENYGYIPFPLGPNGTNYCATIVGSTAVSVPVNAKEPEVMGIVINTLFDYMEGYDDSNVFDYIKKYYFHSDLDFEIYMDTVNNAKYSYWMTFTSISSGGEIFRVLADTVFTGKKTITQYMEENIDTFQACIDEWNSHIGNKN